VACLIENNSKGAPSLKRQKTMKNLQILWPLPVKRWGAVSRKGEWAGDPGTQGTSRGARGDPESRPDMVMGSFGAPRVPGKGEEGRRFLGMRTHKQSPGVTCDSKKITTPGKKQNGRDQRQGHRLVQHAQQTAFAARKQIVTYAKSRWWQRARVQTESQ